MATYTTVTGRTYDLDELTSEEERFVLEMVSWYRCQPSWSEFSSHWLSRARAALCEDEVPVGHPVYRICQDLESRLGIEEGRVARPDIRDRIASLVDERYDSRNEFCREADIDPGHLSRVLSHQGYFSLEKLDEILGMFDLDLDIVRRGHVVTPPLQEEADAEDLEGKLGRVKKRIDALKELEARFEDHPDEALERIVGTEPLLPDPISGVRERVEEGVAPRGALRAELEAACEEHADIAEEIRERSRDQAREYREAS